MKIFKIIQHPLVKNLAIVAIVYFALFSNKENPNSLGNRWSLQNLKKDFDEVTKKTGFIVANVAAVKSYTTIKQEQQPLSEQIASLKAQDAMLGSGNNITCGDVAEISYGIFDGKNKELYRDSENIVLGKKLDLFFEKEIVGMKVGGLRIVKVTKEFVERDSKLKPFMLNAEGEVEYRIKLEKFYKSDDLEIKCEMIEK